MGAELTRENDLAIRRMDMDDLPLLVRWRAQAHVRDWWVTDDDPLPTLATAAERYGPMAGPGSATTACVIELAGTPVGYVQFYRWDSYPDEAREMGIPVDDDAYGLDIFIGDPDVVGTGAGSRAVDLLCRYLFSERGASSVALLTAVDNHRARRAYEKAGLRKIRKALDIDTRGGERIPSWLMVRSGRKPEPA